MVQGGLEGWKNSARKKLKGSKYKWMKRSLEMRYVDWDSPPIHDVYYDNDYENNYGSNKNINDRDDVKNDALIEKLVVECKENRIVVQKQ